MIHTPSHDHTPKGLTAKASEGVLKSSAAGEAKDVGLAYLHVPKGPFSDATQYWDALDKKRDLPLAGAFDLLALPRLVQNMTLFEIDGQRIRIRFVGTSIVEEIGEDTTGSYLDEMPNMSAVQDRAFRCTRTRQAYFLESLPVTWTSKDFVTYSTLGLPLAGQDGEISQIAFLMIFN